MAEDGSTFVAMPVTLSTSIFYLIECGAIDSCEQVLCSNASDHVCDRCESNTGPLPDQMAYINLQTECLGMLF